MTMLNAISLNRTASEHLSEWYGNLDDGKMFYIHYKWGCLDCSISTDETDDVMDAVDVNYVYEKQINDNKLDCDIPEDQMKKHLKKVISFDKIKESVNV